MAARYLTMDWAGEWLVTLRRAFLLADRPGSRTSEAASARHRQIACYGVPTVPEPAFG